MRFVRCAGFADEVIRSHDLLAIGIISILKLPSALILAALSLYAAALRSWNAMSWWRKRDANAPDAGGGRMDQGRHARLTSVAQRGARATFNHRGGSVGRL